MGITQRIRDSLNRESVPDFPVFGVPGQKFNIWCHYPDPDQRPFNIMSQKCGRQQLQPREGMQPTGCQPKNPAGEITATETKPRDKEAKPSKPTSREAPAKKLGYINTGVHRKLM